MTKNSINHHKIEHVFNWPSRLERQFKSVKNSLEMERLGNSYSVLLEKSRNTQFFISAKSKFLLISFLFIVLYILAFLVG